MQNQQVNVDKGQYHTVFQMFDKSNTGQINIKEVNFLIEQLDGAQKSSALLTAYDNHASTTSTNQAGFSRPIASFSTSQQTQLNSGVSAASPSSASSNIKSTSITSQISPPQSLSHQDKIVGATGAYMQGITTKPTNPNSNSNKEELNYGNHFPQRKITPKFPNGKSSIKFDDFLGIIKDTYQDKQLAEKHLLHTFSIFDRDKKGYINAQDLRIIFQILGEKHPEQQIKVIHEQPLAMIKIAGVLSNDKITFKQFKDFFYKQDQ